MQSTVLKSNSVIFLNGLQWPTQGERVQELLSNRTCCKLQLDQGFGRRITNGNSLRKQMVGRKDGQLLRVKASEATTAKTDTKPASLYEILGVQQTATLNEIISAYNAKKQEMSESTDPESKKKLELAYETLGEPESRRIYDFALANMVQSGAEGFVWPYEVDLSQRLPPGARQRVKETADVASLREFNDDVLSDDEQFDLTSDLLILGFILSVLISALLKFGGNSVEAMGEMAVEMWEKLGP